MTRQPPKNVRVAERHPLKLPISTEGGEGQTRDVSTAGVYFTCERGFKVGSRITFSIALDSVEADTPLRLRCSGVVVRVDSSGDEVGVAATIRSYTIEP